ncbi:MFS transporter [Telluribacter sp.]|jgi:MFS family permease|uniref:MFS transporter n=1 Tax=Telluribacter sp. TaxID=1978767 RepID=UPI002E11A6A6|nr:MFS transporter [Telluribacter sp.]
MQTTASPSIFTLQFWLLSLSSFLFFASFNMLIPELPSYLTSLGGAEYKGFIISLFTLTAGLSRPFSGRLTDRIGRVPVMAFGSIVCFICGFLYPIFTSVMPFLLLRLVHGFSTGFKPTGTAAYIADIIPATRRGEALGIHGMCASLGTALGPALGSYIAQLFSIDALFYTSSLFALLSIGILFNMKETLPERSQLSTEAFRITTRDVFDPVVFSPSLVIFLTYFSYGAVLTLVPDYSDYLGLSNHGLYFLVYTLTSLLIRLAAGKVSDRHGRVPVVIVGCVNLIVALVLTAYASSSFIFLGGAVFFGIATGILSPILSAWTADLSHDQNRGRAFGTMYISMEAGIGIGAYISAEIFANRYENLTTAFLLSAALAGAALIYSVVLFYLKKSSTHVIR